MKMLKEDSSSDTVQGWCCNVILLFVISLGFIVYAPAGLYVSFSRYIFIRKLPLAAKYTVITAFFIKGEVIKYGI